MVGEGLEDLLPVLAHDLRAEAGPWNEDFVCFIGLSIWAF
jgi:hypothetical protein